MKKFLLALVLASAAALSHAAPATVATRSWVQKALEKAGVKISTATVTTSNGYTIASSPYTCAEVPAMRSVTFVAAPAVLKQKAVIQAKRSFFLQLIAPTAFAAESEDGSEYYISVTIPSGFWVDNAGNQVEFDFGEGGITITLDEALPGKKTAEDYTHECPSLDENCNCALINPSTEEIGAAYQAIFGKMYDNITAEKFTKWATSPDCWWQDEQNIEQKVKKNGATTYLITDTEGREINFGTLIEKCEAWEAALMQGFEKANEYLLDCKMIARGKMTCDKENPQHAWQDFTCGNNTGKICLNNSAHSEGTTSHDFSSSPWVNNGAAGHSRSCACGESSSGVIAHTLLPSGDKTWNESRTGWTQSTECICGIKSEISHVCEHVYCDPCSAGDGCAEPCPTCKGKHQYVQTTSEDCIECLCEGCHIHPGDDINKHARWLPCEEHPQDETENERGKGEHCVCACGLFSCVSSKWSKKTPRGTVWDFATRVTTHSRTTNDPIKYEQIVDGTEADPEQHWSCAKTECERCGDPYGVREDHEWGEEDEPHYKKLSNEKCALRKVCAKCQFEIYQTEEEAGSHIEDTTIESVYEELENGTQHRKMMTCTKCKEPFYEAKDHAYIEDACGNEVCVCGKRSPDQTKETHKGWTDCGDGTHKCACGKQVVAHIFGEWTCIQESEAEDVWERSCNDCHAKETKTSTHGLHPEEVMCTLSSHHPRYQKCGCVCGYYSDDEKVSLEGTDREYGKVSKSDEFHYWSKEITFEWVSVVDCRCVCQARHHAVEWSAYDKNKGGICENICKACLQYGYYDEYCYTVNNTPATEEDHTEAIDKCGCLCGELDHTATSPRFHPKHPNSCFCYGAAGNGTGSWHYPCARTDCPDICQYDNHLANKGEDPVCAQPQTAGEANHKAKANACGCECGLYKPSTTDGNYVMSATSPLHVKATDRCGCSCGKATEPCFENWHTWEAGACWCMETSSKYYNVSKYYNLANAKHRKIDGVCENVCRGNNHDKGRKDEDGLYGGYYSATDANGKAYHTPKGESLGCGCKCGNFAATVYTDPNIPRFHGGYGEIDCRCQCGTNHTHFAASDCPKACETCGYNRDMTKNDESIHDWNDACVCKCGKFSREHLWSATYTKIALYTKTCTKCGETITVYKNYRECSRANCTESQAYESEEGHASSCSSGGATNVYCYCQCWNCYCDSCKNYRNGIEGGTCTTCGNICTRKSSSSETSGEGGETGGDGGLDDI